MGYVIDLLQFWSIVICKFDSYILMVKEYIQLPHKILVPRMFWGCFFISLRDLTIKQMFVGVVLIFLLILEHHSCPENYSEDNLNSKIFEPVILTNPLKLTRFLKVREDVSPSSVGNTHRMSLLVSL